jgi:hypothetical protein
LVFFKKNINDYLKVEKEEIISVFLNSIANVVKKYRKEYLKAIIIPLINDYKSKKNESVIGYIKYMYDIVSTNILELKKTSINFYVLDNNTKQTYFLDFFKKINFLGLDEGEKSLLVKSLKNKKVIDTNKLLGFESEDDNSDDDSNNDFKLEKYVFKEKCSISRNIFFNKIKKVVFNNITSFTILNTFIQGEKYKLQINTEVKNTIGDIISFEYNSINYYGIIIVEDDDNLTILFKILDENNKGNNITKDKYVKNYGNNTYIFIANKNNKNKFSVNYDDYDYIPENLKIKNLRKIFSYYDYYNKHKKYTNVEVEFVEFLLIDNNDFNNIFYLRNCQMNGYCDAEQIDIVSKLGSIYTKEFFKINNDSNCVIVFKTIIKNKEIFIYFKANHFYTSNFNFEDDKDNENKYYSILKIDTPLSSETPLPLPSAPPLPESPSETPLPLPSAPPLPESPSETPLP